MISYHCPKCNEQLSASEGETGAEKPCPRCQAVTVVPSMAAQMPGAPPVPVGYPAMTVPARSAGRTCSILSIIFGCVAFVLLPPLLGAAGLILGIVGVAKSHNKTAGVVGIILSIVGAVGGMLLSAAIMHHFGR